MTHSDSQFDGAGVETQEEYFGRVKSPEVEYAGEYIDITPTWSGILPALLAILQDGETLEARGQAVIELRRMARLADRYVEHVRVGQSPL